MIIIIPNTPFDVQCSPLAPTQVVVASTSSLVLQASTYMHTFNGHFSGSTRVSRYQKGKVNLDFTEARDSEWQWHRLGHMQVCTLLQTDSHASTPPLSFLQAGCPSCRPTNSVKALKALLLASKVENIDCGQSGHAQVGLCPLQKCPFPRDPDSHLKAHCAIQILLLTYLLIGGGVLAWFLGPTRVHTTNGISIGL